MRGPSVVVSSTKRRPASRLPGQKPQKKHRQKDERGAHDHQVERLIGGAPISRHRVRPTHAMALRTPATSTPSTNHTHTHVNSRTYSWDGSYERRFLEERRRRRSETSRAATPEKRGRRRRATFSAARSPSRFFTNPATPPQSPLAPETPPQSPLAPAFPARRPSGSTVSSESRRRRD